MGVIQRLRARFHDDWCACCQTPMEEKRRQLYTLPMIVGHYRTCRVPDFYKRNLRMVRERADIPPGTYACEVVGLQCPACGHRAVQLSIFLPVRDQEKREDTIVFEHGELDEFFLD